MTQEIENEFIAGVVEGFYGRPWTKEQRFDLFKRLKEYGLNTYMYAPKDDAKHRKCWRELYLEQEQENLKSLIIEAANKGITFVYALSPGLDMIFSCPKDVESLKKKLKQVSDLGCKAFALLFDDIEPELSLPDRQDFDTFADAQVAIANQIYDHLGTPNTFLFCPTEYCCTRAKPSVKKSEYLKILGKKLNKNIDILWTGPKVVSHVISVSSIEEVAGVLKRKPVIWDNSHSNDYDQRRLFLGPYDGRAKELYQHVNGILSNPNCEYECNFIAFHTIKTWVSCCKAFTLAGKDNSNSSEEGNENLYEQERNEEIMKTGDQATAKTGEEVEDMDCTSITKHESDSLKEVGYDNSDDTVEASESVNQLLGYNVKDALSRAVADWVQEFKKAKELKSKNMVLSTSPSKLAVTGDVNSLSDSAEKEKEQDAGLGHQATAVFSRQEDELCDVEEECCPHHVSGKRIKLNVKEEKKSDVTKHDLELLIDLFFLPYEHGKQAKHLIAEFKWLQANALPIDTLDKKSKLVEDWETRAASYHKHCQAVSDMFSRILNAPNKLLVQELYPYIWDVKEVAMLLSAFIKWLGSKTRKCKSGSNLIPEDPEPWMFRGGIAEELERLLPVDMKPDLAPVRHSLVPSPEVYTIRPYLDSDKNDVYNVCRQAYAIEFGDENALANQPDLAGDRFIGAYLQHAKGTFFVLEDENGLCGYCGAALDCKDFNDKSLQWFAEVSKEYQQPESGSGFQNPEQRLIEFLHNPSLVYPNGLSNYPASLVIALLPRAQGTSIGKRILTCLVSVLKAHDVIGVHTIVRPSSDRCLALLGAVGFSKFVINEENTDGEVILVRNLKSK
ncbi:protein O-GlcNAcase-like [Rhopilema esculentum]|uniref:protein O-GlcNAcase-like n=1 Tax=Rhopilema esculentum TaxID=499914 RepID=UPI0031E24332